MPLITYKIIAASAIFLISLIACLYPLKRAHADGHLGERAQLAEALASGIFLGAAFFHMLPEAIKQFTPYSHIILYPLPEFICVLGFIVPLFLERLSFATYKDTNKTFIGFTVLFVLSIHALTEGAALGVGDTLSDMILIAFAIFAHKSSESLALSVTLLRQQFPIKNIFIIAILFSLVTPIGIFLGAESLHITHTLNNSLLPAIINAFAAGTFLYISTLHHTHFHEHRGESQGMWEFLSLTIGVAVMGLTALWT